MFKSSLRAGEIIVRPILSIIHLLFSAYSVWVAELAPITSDQEVPGSKPARGGIQLMTVRRFIAQSLSLTLLLLNTTCPVLATSVDPD